MTSNPQNPGPVRLPPIQSNRFADRGKFLYCTYEQWRLAVVAGLVVAALAWPWYEPVSYWILPVIVLMVVTMVHMAFALKYIVPFPHVAILIACLQYVLAPWLSFYFPPADPTYDIGSNFHTYLMFGGSATLAFALGWGAALPKIKRYSSEARLSSPRLLIELDILFWFGLVCGILARFVDTESAKFFLLLCANLRYVGAIGRMLVNGEGWRWRIALTLLNELLLATAAGMFHTLLLWGVSVFVVYLYRFQPKKKTVILCLVAGLMALPAFQEAKWKLREQLWYGAATDSQQVYQTKAERTVKITWEWVVSFAESLDHFATLNWDPDFISDTTIRYNQGWIINKVMQHVPDEEPYADGETLLTATKAALLPRILFPEKYTAGGRLYMERFAGVKLGESTSMNLGYAGEMYANFGLAGGIAGCFFYALLLGLAFSWIARRASRFPLWWVFVPYVGTAALKAEEGIGEVLNWIVKATLIAAAVYVFFPAIRAALAQKDRSIHQRRPRAPGALMRPGGKFPPAAPLEAGKTSPEMGTRRAPPI